MPINYGPQKITQNGLIFCLDVLNNKSYPYITLPVKDKLALWLDASDATTLSYNSGSCVSMWRDKSGNNYHASQSSAVSCPTSNVGLNGKKVLSFDGSNDYLASPNVYLNSEMTVFCVSNCNNTLFMEHSPTANSNDGFYFYGGGGGMMRVQRNPSLSYISLNAWLAGGYSIAAGSNSTGLDITCYYTGSPVLPSFYNTSSFANTYTTNTFYIGSRAGSALFTTGSIGEIIIYNKKLSTLEMSKVDSYLYQKWSISTSDKACFDLSGNNFTASIMNTTSFITASNVPAFSFDGGTNYMDLGINAYNLGIRRYATFTGWMTALNTGPAYLVSDWNGVGMTLRFNNNTSTDFYVYGANHRITYVYNFNPGTWYHLTGVMDGDYMYMYINGVWVATQTLAEDIGSSPSTLKIGCRGDITNLSNQKVACLQIYNKALTSSEIYQNYKNTKDRFIV